MGFWKKLLGVGEIAGGLVTGNPGLVATGAGTLAADSQNGSVSKANQQQQTATNQAQGKLDQVYQTAQQSYAPYQQTGTGALSALNLGMGLQPLPSSPVSDLTGLAQRMSGGGAVPRNPAAANLSNLAATPQSLEQALARSPQAAESQTQSGYVQMQSPDGRVGRVPAAMVDQAVAAGGKVIGGVNG